MKNRYNVILVENGRYAVYDEYRKIRLNEEYNRLDTGTRVAQLFNNINIMRCRDEQVQD